MGEMSAEREWLAEVGMRVRVARVRRRESEAQLAAQAAVSRVTLGKRIWVLPVVRELTQDELAQSAGATRNQVSAFECAAQRLDVVALVGLAAALDVSVPELLAAPMRTDVPSGTVPSFEWDSER